MIHVSHLNNEPFLAIQSGVKTIELRVNDEKRRGFSVGDLIKFINRITKKELMVEITALYKYKSFTELYKNFTGQQLGYKKWQRKNPKDMEKYYPLEEQVLWGVVAIELKIKKTR